MFGRSKTQSLTNFERNTSCEIDQIKASGHPLILTVNGKAEVVVQEIGAYRQMLRLAAKAEMMEFLRESKRDADAGRTVLAKRFLAKLGRKKGSRKR